MPVSISLAGDSTALFWLVCGCFPVCPDAVCSISVGPEIESGGVGKIDPDRAGRAQRELRLDAPASPKKPPDDRAQSRIRYPRNVCAPPHAQGA